MPGKTVRLATASGGGSAVTSTCAAAPPERGLGLSGITGVGAKGAPEPGSLPPNPPGPLPANPASDGKSASASIYCACNIATALSTRLRISRTLPGQECRSKTCSASAVKPLISR